MSHFGTIYGTIETSLKITTTCAQKYEINKKLLFVENVSFDLCATDSCNCVVVMANDSETIPRRKK